MDNLNKSNNLKVAYWNTNNNFGDCLTPILLERLFGIKSEWVEPEKAEFVGIGSLLETFSKNYKGIIWGSGKMFEESEIDLSEAKVLALRGKLTLSKTKCECSVFGDPGLLAKLIAPTGIKKEYEFGIINHWNDKRQKYGEHNNIIDITSGIDNVILETLKCKKIVTSSLHGLILADSLGIPRLWSPSESSPGGSFKFDDYQSNFGIKLTPYKWYKIDPKKVDEINKKLINSLKSIL